MASVYTGSVTEQELSAAALATVAAAPVRSPAAGDRVLVVDDHPGMRLLMEKSLGRAGYAVTMNGPWPPYSFVQD